MNYLNPRFKLISPYPGSTQEVGSITTEISTASYLRKFTANFKELEWWEDLNPNELPKYVKWNHGGVFEVINWRSNPNTAQLDGVYVGNLPLRSNGFLFIKDLLPATEYEYKNQ